MIFTAGALATAKAIGVFTAKKYAMKTGISVLKNSLAHAGAENAATKIGHGVAQEVGTEASSDLWDFISEIC